MLETPRLILRRFAESDTDAIFAMRRDAEIMRFIRAPQTNREETLSWLRLVSSKWEEEKIGFCAVIEKAANEMIGWCGLWKLKETSEVEVGYAIARKHWKKGFASEAAEAFLQYGFDELNLKEIVAVAHPENQASQSVMKRLGMTFDYIGKFYEIELVHFSITKGEWQRLRAINLQQC